MFSGIIREVGEVKEITPQAGYTQFQVDIRSFARLVALGDSIAHNGVCLTVAALDGTLATYDLLTETMQKTSLGSFTPGQLVNLERSLALGDQVDGHLVYGHVDGVGTVVAVETNTSGTRITIRPPSQLMRYIVPQGAIAVDGVSLTIASYSDDTFTISLVPYTIDYTAFQKTAVGDIVNIEADMLAKYAERVLSNHV